MRRQSQKNTSVLAATAASATFAPTVVVAQRRPVVTTTGTKHQAAAAAATATTAKPAAAPVDAVTAARNARRARFVKDQKHYLLNEHHDNLFELPHDTDHKHGIDAVDGNQAVAHVAYGLSEVACIYPITPATAMGEVCDAKAAAGNLNCFGQKLSVVELESEGGAAGALHGSAASGALSVTFTSAQGLLLMIPNMYKLAGELTPCVMHVASRPLSMQATTLYPDHQDVMGVRQTGWTMLCSETPQMAHDMAILAHIGAIASSVPVLHFFDGFRTSHEINKVELVSYDKLRKVVPEEALEKYRATSLSPTRPVMRGMAIGQESFFAQYEAGNPIRDRVPQVLCEAAEKIAKEVTGRQYAFYAYEGPADAEHVVVVMGSAAHTVEQAARIATEQYGAKCGIVKIRLFRPFCMDAFVDAIPKTAKVITVLDRVSEPFAAGEPLYLDVAASLQKRRRNVLLLKGRYGLGGKEFTPGMALSVYLNSAAAQPRENFSVGIEDDVSGYSLPLPKQEPAGILPKGTTECLFFGLGSDGTVLANKIAVKVINKHTPLHAQAYFQYDAKKSGSLTVSHVRFGPEPINAPFLVQFADYIAIHRYKFLNSFETLAQLRAGGSVVLNTHIKPSEAEKELPPAFRQKLAELGAKLYFVDASKVASVCGLGKIINMIMQAVFFRLSSVLPYDEAIELLIADVRKSLRKKDDTVINNNIQAIKLAERSIQEVEVPASWKDAVANATATAEEELKIVTTNMPKPLEADKYFNSMKKLLQNAGDSIPVSAFNPGGIVPTSTSWREKRGIALNVPQVDMSKCIQCGKCSIICPHAAIRPFLLTDAEAAAAPPCVKASGMVQAQGEEVDQYQYRVQVSPLDCTGCQQCTRICPSGALSMRDADAAVKEEHERWNYLVQLPQKTGIDKSSVRGSQFQQPLFEFSAACEGCGETPYLKLLTQLFGSQLVVANATGCSSIYSSWTPSIPYTVNEHGEGPTWSNSLFEDNAEYGLGIQLGHLHRRKEFLRLVEDVIKNPPAGVTPTLIESLQSYIAVAKPAAEAKLGADDPLRRMAKPILTAAYRRIAPLLAAEQGRDKRLEKLHNEREFFMKLNFWTIGGDGWAYDIGFGGLDHVLHSVDVESKVLVLDTEVYSNTGGQRSKATPMGAQAKFSEAGKDVPQKDLGRYAMSLKNVYVASVSLHANQEQAVRALLEAEQYPGPALVICYSPCIAHGMPMSDAIEHCQKAVASGFWPLYRYNPLLAKSGNNPFQLDSHKITTELLPLLKSENRFSAVMRADEANAAELDTKLAEFVVERNRALQVALSTFGLKTGASAATTASGPVTVVAYGSETGHAAEQAQALVDSLIARGEKNVRLCALDELTVGPNLSKEVQRLMVVISTTGLGEFPHNARGFVDALKDPSLPLTFLEGMEFSVFGLGDSTYHENFCKAAATVDVRLAELGAKRLQNRGVGDDQNPDRYFAGWEQWEGSLIGKLKLEDRPVAKAAARYRVTQTLLPDAAAATASLETICPRGFAVSHRDVHRSLTPPGYERVIHHHEFRIPTKATGAPALSYKVGDSLAVLPANDDAIVDRALKVMGWFENAERTQVSVSSADPNPTSSSASHFPAMPMSLKQLVKHFVDLSRRPPKHFFTRLSAFAKDPAEAEKLKALGGSTTESDKEYQALIRDQSWNCVDVLESFKSTNQLTLEEFLTLMPRSTPRLYSISSSPRQAKDSIHLTTLRTFYDAVAPSTKETERRFGLCSSYLARNDSSNAFVKVQRGSIHVPSPSTPLLLVGTGTGLAPWRGVIQDRQAAYNAGEKVGPTRLYFGTYKKDENLYPEEFTALSALQATAESAFKDSFLTVRTAFSHDQAKRIFVQHRMEEDAPLIADWFLNRGAHFRMCGGSRLPDALMASLRRILVTEGKLPDAEAEALLNSWLREGRIAFETY